MALKSGRLTEAVAFIPDSQKDTDKPTTFWGMPMTKGEYDEWQEHIQIRYKKNKVKFSQTDANFSLYKNRIVKIENLFIDGKFTDVVDNPEQIATCIKNLQDTEAAAEVENWLKGISSLDEDEEKNSE